MIDIQTLKEIGRLKGIANLGHIEKDYIQEILLLLIYRNFNFLVFKGGTCLYKFYKLSRFSEDLDFSAIGDFDLTTFLRTVESGLERFNLRVNKTSHKMIHGSHLIKIRVEGVLYGGSPAGLCTIRVDINTKSAALRYHTLNLKPLYPDIPSFDVLVMSREEMLAEKVRAVMTRAKARDIYDLWFLVRENTAIDVGLIEQKFRYYGTVFTLEGFRKHLNMGKEVWSSELAPLIKDLPPFRDVMDVILGKFESSSAK